MQETGDEPGVLVAHREGETEPHPAMVWWPADRIRRFRTSFWSTTRKKRAARAGRIRIIGRSILDLTLTMGQRMVIYDASPALQRRMDAVKNRIRESFSYPKRRPQWIRLSIICGFCVRRQGPAIP